MTHDLPLPECFNNPLEKALSERCDYVWFVEEDMVIPPDTLDKMFEMTKQGYKVVSVDYANKNNGESFVKKNEKGEILFTGMGCMLIDVNVFSVMEKPYVRQMVYWIKTNDKEITCLEPHPELPTKGYGTQDVYLCQTLIKNGNAIGLIDAKIGHLKLIEKSDPLSNNGQHVINEVYLK